MAGSVDTKGFTEPATVVDDVGAPLTIQAVAPSLSEVFVYEAPASLPVVYIVAAPIANLAFTRICIRDNALRQRFCSTGSFNELKVCHESFIPENSVRAYS